jgi:hypothetical protein
MRWLSYGSSRSDGSGISLLNEDGISRGMDDAKTSPGTTIGNDTRNGHPRPLVNHLVEGLEEYDTIGCGSARYIIGVSSRLVSPSGMVETPRL